MKKLFLAFYAEEAGAITVDFVALTAAICLLGAFVVNTFSAEPIRMANNMSSFMQSQCSDDSCD